MQNNPLISNIICTYNNSESLLITLNQLLKQKLEFPEEYEIIIIDNNSQDLTGDICKNFIKQSAIPARYIFEDRQGLSYARNTGIENATGKYILFTDDDADLPSDWLETYSSFLKKYDPDCIYSKISIIWDKPQPWWFIPNYTPYFVGLDYGNKLIQVKDLHKEFYGKNFCMKKNVLLELGGFDPALGRKGSKLLAGEETLLYRKLIAQNKKVFYIPDAPVGHRLKEREYSEENIRKLYIDGAESAHHIARLTARKKIFGRPLGSILENTRTLAKSLVYYLFLHWKNSDAVNFYHKINIQRSIIYLKIWIKIK